MHLRVVLKRFLLLPLPGFAASSCARAALAVYEDGTFVLYRLADTPVLKDKRLAWIGRPVEVRGTLGKDAKGSLLQSVQVSEVPWASLGFPTAPSSR